ncbi:MAG: hypothetical protein SOU08_06720 [Anaerococcus sp.]|nr:hypothetical protein [Peptoniphilaceae bacterium]MDY2919313.1 hypothetical protein [Anaerococcus sp.]
MRGFDPIFTLFFFIVLSLGDISSYYLTNKSFDKIRTDRMIGLSIPLAIVFMVILAILVNILIYNI